MKRVAILQSNYIPWKGYFDIINSVDEFIFYDEVQYTKHDWRNRNKIKTRKGTQWLSIPINTKGMFEKKLRIIDATVCDTSWTISHWSSIKQNYHSSPYFKKYSHIFEDLYSECSNEIYLSVINYNFIYAINKILNIETKLSFSQDYGLVNGKTERLIDLVLKAGGDTYLSGPSAKHYIDTNLFASANINLEWMDYSGYPEYNQLYPPFIHEVSILDLIFNCGPNSKKFMLSAYE